ncbi:MAG: DUF488 domain-containing protein [Candidatus Thermoplasmatota archaeon]|jgi:uncharacterized protein YeaO (DUF488 family)|nr:DUF488 domain-containing protein [Candidatus Thermoplasmatota archaeon]MCL5791271.1 DUF488 domain-containing protein [Candidatus Thermoplasmatota archaeon]
MIRIKRIYDDYSLEDGRRILVDRIWPRGISREKAMIDEWMKDIAPSTDLRKWFSHDPGKWEKFREEYRKELCRSGDIARLRNGGNITLLYSARDREHNNAIVIREILEDYENFVNQCREV